MSQPPQDPYSQQPPQQPYQQQPYQQQPYQQYPQQYGYGQPAAPTNSMAVVALISGIAGLTVLPFLASIVAVICGPMARKQIAQTGEQGSGMATAGIITGWVGVGLGALGILLWILFMVVFATSIGTLSTY